ncbi:MAG: NAD(P)H-binding protein [Candidatus Thorarchaeota archaeon]
MVNILVLGSTGYVGSRLVERLVDEGYNVHAGWRTESKLKSQSWKAHPKVQTVHVDVLDIEELKEAMKGCDVVFYLVHSMYSGKDFANLDRQAAKNIVTVADELGTKRIIYLGGLGRKDDELSLHLRSRKEVERILRSSKTPVTTFQAAMIIGPGSASFEIMRYLVNRLPVMLTPKWVRTKTQPISIEDTIEYLVGCISKPDTVGQSFDIGGPEITTYQDLMTMYATEAGLIQRLAFPIPLLTPNLSSYWVELVTPIQATIARPLIEGLSHETICRDNRIRKIIPRKLLTIRESIQNTLSEIYGYKFGKSKDTKQFQDVSKSRRKLFQLR